MALGARAEPGQGTLLEGWAQPEDGFVWALGPESMLVLTPTGAPAGGQVLLELDVNPFVLPGSTAGQALRVTVGAPVVGEDRVLGEGTLAYAVPWSAWHGGPARVTLTMPEARRPIDLGFNDDRRLLGFMLRSAALRRVRPGPAVPGRVLPPIPLPEGRDGGTLRTALLEGVGLDAAELTGGFESLGHSCEFGLVQRHCGAERIGLLRFASITLPNLVRALESGFGGVGAPAQTEVSMIGGARREFMLHDTRHNFSLHTLRFEGETTEAAVRQDAARQLGFRHRLFVEALESGRKMFVFQRRGQILQAQARALLARLQAHGPNALLFVMEGTAPPGTVEELDYGFFRGWLDRMAPEADAGACNLGAWLSLCANARRLWDVQTATLRLSGR